jgi:hypothetical protein
MIFLGAGNMASLYATAGVSDTVVGSYNFVALNDAEAIVVGSNDFADFYGGGVIHGILSTDSRRS